MTILSRFYPETYWSPFGGYNGWRSEDPRRGWYNSSWESIFDSPRNPSGMAGVSIPIVIDDDNIDSSFQDYYEFCDCDSNSDSENDDLNQNSLPMSRKRRYERTQRQSPVPSAETEQGRSKDLPSPSKQKLKQSNSKHPCSSRDVICDIETTSKKQYGTKSNPAARKEVIFLEDDDECEINEITSYEVYTHLKKLLKKCGRCIDEMRGDGNCFFRALSKVVYGNQTFYDDIRQAVVDLIAKHPRKFEAVTDGPVSSHVRDMRRDKTWATQTEIYAAATLLGRAVYILSPDQKGDNYKWLLFSPLFEYNRGKLDDPCYITICHTHGNHYDRIAPLKGKCNCALDPPELSGFKGSVDLTVDENEIV